MRRYTKVEVPFAVRCTRKDLLNIAFAVRVTASTLGASLFVKQIPFVGQTVRHHPMVPWVL
jgi:hypothetical protein